MPNTENSIEEFGPIELEMSVSAATTVQAPVDATLKISGVAADAKVTGDTIAAANGDIDELESDVSELQTAVAAKVAKPTTNGTNGQLLQTNGDGTTSWTTHGTPTDEQVSDAVDSWLGTNVPSGTTIAVDRTLTMSNAAAPADIVGGLKSAFDTNERNTTKVCEYVGFPIEHLTEHGKFKVSSPMDLSVESTDDTKGRTNVFNLIAGSHTMTITSGYEFQLYEQTFSGGTQTTEKITNAYLTSYEFTANANANYRALIRRTDQGGMASDDLSKVFILTDCGGLLKEVEDIQEEMFNLLSDKCTDMSNGDDLNDYITVGNYKTTSGAMTASLLHAPTNLADTAAIRLLVFQTRDSDRVWQAIFSDTSRSNKVYIRSYVSSTSGWSQWYQIATTTDIEAVGAIITQEIADRTALDYRVVIKNLIPYLSPRTRTPSGLTIVQNDDYSFTITNDPGLSDDYAQLNIYYNRDHVPTWMKPGKYRIQMQGGTEGIRLYSYAYTKPGESYVPYTLVQNEAGDEGFYDFEFESRYTGFALYVRVYDETILPKTVKITLVDRNFLSDVNTSKGIVEENEDKQVPIIQNKCVRASSDVTDRPVVAFTHFSDVHGQQDAWDRTIEFTNAYKDYIDFAIFTGDYVVDHYTANARHLIENGPSCAKPLYMCVGNHDVYENDTQPRGQVSKSTIYDLMFTNASKANAVFMSGDYSMTYYVDLASSYLRCIVLDDYYDIEDQKTWLVSILNEALSNHYAVATFTHQPTGQLITPVDCTFMTLDTQNSSFPSFDFDSIIGDFIDAGGEFVANFAGHDHKNYIGYTTNGVLNVLVPSSSGAKFNSHCDSGRVKGTRTFDCFDIVGIDTNTKRLKIIRIGNNADHYLRPQNVVCYDYANKTITCNY